MKTLIAALTLTVCFAAQSQVVIYKHKVTGSVVGAGASSKPSVTGYTILDSSTGDIVQVNTTKLKTYWNATWQDHVVHTIAGPAGQKLTVIAKATTNPDPAASDYLDSLTVKGVNVNNVNIGASKPYSLPTKMTHSGRSLYYLNGQLCLEESTGTLAIDSKLTQLSNTSKDTFQGAVGRVTALLELQGYRER